MFKQDFKKAEEPEIKCQYSLDHCKRERAPEKHIFALLTMPKPLTVWITTNCGKFLNR